MGYIVLLVVKSRPPYAWGCYYYCRHQQRLYKSENRTYYRYPDTRYEMFYGLMVLCNLARLYQHWNWRHNHWKKRDGVMDCRIFFRCCVLSRYVYLLSLCRVVMPMCCRYAVCYIVVDYELGSWAEQRMKAWGVMTMSTGISWGAASILSTSWNEYPTPIFNAVDWDNILS